MKDDQKASQEFELGIYSLGELIPGLNGENISFELLIQM